MKRIISLLLTLLMLGTITACNDTADTKEEYLDWVYVREQTTRGAVSDQGYYYLDGLILSYVDFASGLSAALCSRAGCKHKEYDCDAYIGIGAFSPMYFENDRIYYADGGTIYRRNATGIEYAEVGVIGKKYLEERKGVEPKKFAVTGDYLYYLADIQEITSEGSTTTVKATMQTIGRVNLNTGKDELLVEEALDRDTEKLLLCAVCKNGIIYHHWKGVEKGLPREERVEAGRYMPTDVILLDVQTGEHTTLFTKSMNDCSAVTMVYGEKIFYKSLTTLEEGSGATYAFDLKTGEDNLVSELVMPKQIGGGYILGTEKNSNTTCLYDMINQKVLPVALEKNPEIYNTSDKGFVAAIDVVESVDEDNEKHTKSCYFVAYSDLADGLQESDFKKLYVDSEWTQPKQ